MAMHMLWPIWRALARAAAMAMLALSAVMERFSKLVIGCLVKWTAIGDW
jgi:hypothetical protein